MSNLLGRDQATPGGGNILKLQNTKTMREKDRFTRSWIIENALEEIVNYNPGVLTIRTLHYRLVSRGMTNTTRHYKRVVSAMIKARWERLVSFGTFSDHERETLGETDFIETSVEKAQLIAERQIELWMQSYKKNTWENQDTYLEVWVEKKALQGVFEPICNKYDVLLAPCKGYPSLTFLNDAKARFREAEKTHETKILYFGDYDPSGEDIPRSLQQNLYDLGIIVNVDRRLLLEHQVINWGLPPAPAKDTDSRTANWDGLGQVELDAVEPKKLQRLIEGAILEHLDPDRHKALLEAQEQEGVKFRDNLKQFVKTL